MENDVNQEPVTITLSVAQWNQILGVISLSPFQAVNQISDAVNHLQSQAGPQIEAAVAKYPAPEAEAAE
jgi:hypothetical protein